MINKRDGSSSTGRDEIYVQRAERDCRSLLSSSSTLTREISRVSLSLSVIVCWRHRNPFWTYGFAHGNRLSAFPFRLHRSQPSPLPVSYSDRFEFRSLLRVGSLCRRLITFKFRVIGLLRLINREARV